MNKQIIGTTLIAIPSIAKAFRIINKRLMFINGMLHAETIDPIKESRKKRLAAFNEMLANHEAMSDCLDTETNDR